MSIVEGYLSIIILSAAYCFLRTGQYPTEKIVKIMEVVKLGKTIRIKKKQQLNMSLNASE